MDIRMPRVDGLDRHRGAARRGRDPPEVLVLTTFDADEQVLRALRAGAGGFLLKDTPPAEIVQAVRRVAAGEAMLSPGGDPPADRPRDRAGAAGGPDPRRERALRLLAGLSEREREVAVALGRGRTNAEIARRAVHERGDGQGVRVAAADQARPEQPGPGGPAGARRRPGLRSRSLGQMGGIPTRRGYTHFWLFMLVVWE